MLLNICRVCARWRVLETNRLPLKASQSPVDLRIKNTQGLRYMRSSAVVLQQTDGEKKMTKILTEKLNPTYILVRDISGGCGSMYEVVIDSEQFKGKRMIQQHRMINEALGEEIKSLHGLTIRIENPEAGQ